MTLRLRILGFDVASLVLEFPDTVTVTPGYPPTVQTQPLPQPMRDAVRRGIKKLSPWWVSEMSA